MICLASPHLWSLRVFCGIVLHGTSLCTTVKMSKTKRCIQNKWIGKYREECLIMKVLIIFKIINRSELKCSVINPNRMFQFKWITIKLKITFLVSLYIPGIGYHFNSDESVSYAWRSIPKHNSKIRSWDRVSSVVLNRASKSLVPWTSFEFATARAHIATITL